MTFVSVFGDGNAQLVLLQHCATADAASLSMTCQGLRCVFKEKLHNLQELYLDVDVRQQHVDVNASVQWERVRDLLDRLKVLSRDLVQVRKFVIGGANSTSLPIFVEILRTHFREVQELHITPKHGAVAWSPLLHWLPDTIHTLQIGDFERISYISEIVRFGNWSKNLRVLRIECRVPVILESNISLDTLVISGKFRQCRGVVHIRNLEVEWLNNGCLEGVVGVSSLCVYSSRVPLADIMSLCPDLIELRLPRSSRRTVFVDFDLSHSTSLQRLCIHHADQKPWRVPAGCEIVRCTPLPGHLLMPESMDDSDYSGNSSDNDV